jgi:hypothetical protein
LARRAAGDPPVEDELHRIGAPDVEILPDHLFEETAPGARMIQDLGQRKLRLEDRQVVATAGFPMGRRERVREVDPLSCDEAPLLLLTRPCLRPFPPVITRHNMLDGLTQGLVGTLEL